MASKKLGRSELVRAIDQADKELAQKGIPLRRRQWDATQRAREILHLPQKIGIAPFSFSDGHDKDLSSLFEELYGDALNGGFGHGIVEFRGVPYFVHVPVIYGSVRIEPFEQTEFTPFQKAILFSDTELYERALFQIADAFDALMGLSNFLTKLGHDKSKNSEDAHRLLSEGRRNLLASGTLAVRGEDPRECVLSGFVSLELSIKAYLAHRGKSEKELRALGHSPRKFATCLGEIKNQFDFDLVSKILDTCPDFIKTRYGEQIPSHEDAVNFALNVQLLLAELFKENLGKRFLDDYDGQKIRRPF